MSEQHETEFDEAQEPVVVRDRRKVDPETGQLREPDQEAEELFGDTAADSSTAQPFDQEADPGEAEAVAEAEVVEEAEVVPDLQKQLDDRTADLQRVQAEYANYRRRMEREREEMTAAGKSSIANDLLPLLDDLERAEAHGDLTGAFKAVSDKLVGVLEKSGLESFGVEGDAFDPTVHEAVQHDTSTEVSGPTVTTVLRRGYRFDDRVLRHALVGVTDHEPTGQSAPESDEQTGSVDGELPTDTDETTG